MKLDHTRDTTHSKWLAEFDERFGQLLETGRFRVKENTLLGRTWVPERLIALSSGLMRELRSAGRIGRGHEFRIELLDRADQVRVRNMFGDTTEWISAKQIHQATGAARSTASRRCEQNAALLIVARSRMRIIDGEIKLSADWLIKISHGEARRRLQEYCLSRDANLNSTSVD